MPTADRGPTDPRNIKGVVTQVNDHGGYKVGTKMGFTKVEIKLSSVRVKL